MTDILDQLRSHIKCLERKIGDLEFLVESKNGEIRNLEDALRTMKKKHVDVENRLEVEIDKLRTDIQNQNDTIDKLKGKED